MVRLLHVVLVDDLAVHADAGVLVDDGPLDGGAGADANGGAAGEVLTLVGLLVVVSAHDHDVLDDAVLLDVGAETDHRVGELALLDEAAVADGALGDLGIEKLAGGEEARLGVDGGTSLVEAELGLLGVVAREVSVEECLDGTDILPVAIVEECLNVHAEVLGVGDDLTAEVVARGEVLHKQLLHGPGVEDVDSHGRDVRHLLGALGIESEDGGVHHHRLEGVARGLLGEVNDLAGVINLHEAERRGALLIHGHSGDGDVSLGLSMLEDEGLVVHAVEVITGKDDVLVALGLVEEPDVLAHSIRGALEPVLVLGRLLRGEHLDETLAVVGADVVVVRLRKVSVERGGVELREAVHLVDVGVDAVGHGQVDEPVVGAKGNRGLGAGLGERIQAGARTTAEDDAEDILRCEEDGYWRQSRGRVLQWGKGAFLLRARSGEQKRAEQTRALTSVLSLTSVAVSVAISALVATARVTRFTCVVGGGMGEGLSQNDARVLGSAAHAVCGCQGKKRRAHSPRPSARHGGTRRPYRAQPGGSLWMGGYQRGCVSQLVYESLESAVASGRNDVTPTVRSAGDWTSERKTGQKIGNARRRTHRTWRGRRRTRKWAPGRAWRQPAFSLDRRETRGVLRADGIWFFGAVPHPVFFEGEGKKTG